MSADILNILYKIFLVVQVFIAFFLVLPFLENIISIFIFRRQPKPGDNEETDFACVITGYKETGIIVPLIDSLLKQKYSNYKIYVVADNCSAEEIEKLNLQDERVRVLIPSPPLNSKVKAIRFAIKSYERKHGFTVIFDPDNLTHPDFLSIINSFVLKGYKAVQGRRVAKNLNTLHSCLDALGEIYYNKIVRENLYLLGSSAVIAGSGMAIETELYSEILHSASLSDDNKVIVAEDKILQFEIVNKGYIIAFAGNAVVFDEKVSTGAQVERQKTRWLNSYFKYLKLGYTLIFKGLVSFNFNRFLFGLNVAIPPLIVVNGLSFLFFLSSFTYNFSYALIWFVLIFLFGLNLIIVMIQVKTEKEIWKSLFGLPFFLLNQIFAILKLKKSNKDFLITEKTQYVYIDEVLKKFPKWN